MRPTITDIADVRPIRGDEAAAVARAEYGRMSEVLRELGPDDWRRQTPNDEWDVRALVGHLTRSVEQYAAPLAMARSQVVAKLRARRSGRPEVDEWTAAHVEDTAGASTEVLIDRFDAAREKAVRTRMRTPKLLRGMTADDGHGNTVTLGGLMDVIATRDSWMHRDDLARTTGRSMTLTADHDGRIVEDVVREWAQRHGEAFDLVLTGPAGGAYRRGAGGPHLQLDAVEFCRILSGRGEGEGLLAQGVPF